MTALATSTDAGAEQAVRLTSAVFYRDLADVINQASIPRVLPVAMHVALLLLRTLGASAFQCATRPSTDSWRTSVARVPAVAMDLMPESGLDEAMKAMQA